MRVDSRGSSSCSSLGSRSSRSRSSWRNRRRTGEFFFTCCDELPVVPLGPLGDNRMSQELMEKQTQDRWIISLLTYLVMTGLRIRYAFFRIRIRIRLLSTFLILRERERELRSKLALYSKNYDDIYICLEYKLIFCVT